MIVAAEPALAAAVSAIRNGRGSRPRRSSPSASIGVIANTTTSLASTAESRPETATVSASRAGGPTGVRASRREHQS